MTFHPGHLIARIRPMFYDEARATVANSGASGQVRLALTDPDSNEVVPSDAARFAGDFMLTSQGDKEQIFVRRPATRRPALSVLRLSQSVDDTAWATSHDGRLYATDNGAGTVDVITGPFTPGSVFEAVTPCDANGAPASCRGQVSPANYLGALNPWTGHISRAPVGGTVLHPEGHAVRARHALGRGGRPSALEPGRTRRRCAPGACVRTSEERYRMFIRMGTASLRYSIVCSCSSASGPTNSPSRPGGEYDVSWSRRQSTGPRPAGLAPRPCGRMGRLQNGHVLGR